ncbi:MAG: sugar phosphate isomerase/epimerase family protein [Bacteroidota bacterium]
MRRRKFLASTALASFGWGLSSSLATGIIRDHEPALQVHLFSKVLQFLDDQELAEALGKMGFDGADLTVRPKGHVEPARVAEDLPRFTQALKAVGLQPLMITTNILQAADPVAQAVLKVARDLGYRFYRPAWIKYQAEDALRKRLVQAKEELGRLADLSKTAGITGSYQNHSGHYLGAGIWDLDEALGDISPRHMGVQYDIAHATIEGGRNWEVEFRLIQPHITTLAIKDFIWKKTAGIWKVHYVPLGEGMVDWQRYFSLLKAAGMQPPMSLHAEYDLGGAEDGKQPIMSPSEIFARLKKDLDWLRKTWQETE